MSFINVNEPVGAYGWSKYLKSVVDLIVSSVNTFKSESDVAFQAASDARAAISASVSQEVADRQAAVSTLEASVTAGFSDAQAARDVLSASISQEVTDRQAAVTSLEETVTSGFQQASDARAVISSSLTTEIDNRVAGDANLYTMIQTEIGQRVSEISRVDGLITTVNNVSSGLDSRLSDLETWKTNNIDELVVSEVDKAIALKVDDTLFQSVKTALESQDTQFSQDLSAAIANRENKDTQHDGQLAKIEQFISLLMATYHLEDANGNVITSVADVVV